MDYLTLKALHFIGAVSWFAGIFYMPRLLIYDVEANERPEPERRSLQTQLRIMQRRLWFIITTPAMVFTLVFGIWLVLRSGYWREPWFHLKATLLLGLVAYHHVMGRIRRQLEAGACRWTSTQLRLWNELATLLLIGIVLSASLKAGVFHWSVPAGVVGTIGGLTAGVMLYKKVRVARARESNAERNQSAPKAVS